MNDLGGCPFKFWTVLVIEDLSFTSGTSLFSARKIVQ